MSEIFRKHYSFGETIPIVNIYIGATIDIYQDPQQTNPEGGPYLTADIGAQAGPIKLPVAKYAPLNDKLEEDIEFGIVPIPVVGKAEFSLHVEIDDWKWMPASGGDPEDGTATFSIVAIAEGEVTVPPVGTQTIKLHLAEIPVSITLTKQANALQAHRDVQVLLATSHWNGNDANLLGRNYLDALRRFEYVASQQHEELPSHVNGSRLPEFPEHITPADIPTREEITR